MGGRPLRWQQTEDDRNNQLKMMGVQPLQSQEGRLCCCPRGKGVGGWDVVDCRLFL
jgi:hypothetical protein